MRSLIRHFVVISLACAGLLLSSAAMAAKGGGLLSQRTYDALQDIHELMEEEKYNQALSLGRELIAKVKGSEYETAVVKQNIAYIYIYKGEYETAASYLKEALALNVFADHEERSATIALANVYLSMEQYRQAINVMLPYVNSPDAGDLPPSAFIIVASSYAQLDQYREALPYAKKAISMSDSPSEDWYNLLLAIYFELNQYRNAAQTLETMITMWPQRNRYWVQLSQIYIELEENDKALSTLKLAYEQGMLEQESDLLNLVQLYMYQEVPYEAAKVLSKGLENGDIEPTAKHYDVLANAYIQAREYDKAVQALAKAGEKSDDGDYYLRQAQLYASQQQWSEVVKAVDKATSAKLDDEDMGTAYLLQGMAAVEDKKYDQALRSFNKAADFEKSEDQAEQWIRYVRNDLMNVATNY